MSKKLITEGTKFGKLTVCSPPNSINGRLYYTAKCDCGKKIVTSGSHLRRKQGTRSCGCLTRNKTSKLDSIKGNKFSNLTAIKKIKGSIWLFKCDCGVKKQINAYAVVSNITMSCGCYNKEKSTGDNHPNFKGGKFINEQGYVYVSSRVLYGKKGFEHRLIMEKHLGRCLNKNENVHHKNGNRSDNRIENLELWVKSQPSGQRVEDLIKWAKKIISDYSPGYN
jgi:hypothetical protein